MLRSDLRHPLTRLCQQRSSWLRVNEAFPARPAVGEKTVGDSVSARVAAALDRRRLGDTPFTVVASDCWGGAAYKALGREYNTPFVGLFVEPDDFARLTSDLEGYLAAELRFIDSDEPYPVAMLGGDVQLNFMHYASEEEARAKWDRRRKRMDWDAIRVCARAKDARGKVISGVVRQHTPGALVLGPAELAGGGVLGVRNHQESGQRLYDMSLQEFDVVTWLADNRIVRPRRYQLALHGLSRLKRRLKGAVP